MNPPQESWPRVLLGAAAALLSLGALGAALMLCGCGKKPQKPLMIQVIHQDGTTNLFTTLEEARSNAMIGDHLYLPDGFHYTNTLK